ncbi:helix-turn-helix transcriptional regulator [Haloarchaeobius sp. HRN-SO-5]|uniref:helix-turn-helix transcriptional regulator n=1 Tax=Haloarchaeobius sp. HRN-SO-5 TaxID=3446118 RepID=UPI003EBC88C9
MDGEAFASDGHVDDSTLVELLKRRAVFGVLDGDACTKTELADELDVSKATAHRIIASFTEKGLITQPDGEYELTPYGHRIGTHVAAFHDGVARTTRLEPLFELLADAGVAFDPDAFAGATMTRAEPGDPYRPVRRFVDLVAETTTLRGLDTTSIAPVYVERIHEAIAAGMETTAVYETGVVERLAESYPDLATDAFEQDNLTIFVVDELPFGLTLFDDRVGVGGYDDELGTLAFYADTDEVDALEWGEELFERYRDEAVEVV